MKNRCFPLQMLLGSRFAPLEGLSGPLWEPLGRSWALLGLSWGAFGCPWGAVGTVFGRSWAHLGALGWPLGTLGRFRDALGDVLGCFWVTLEAFFGHPNSFRICFSPKFFHTLPCKPPSIKMGSAECAKLLN